MDFDFRLYYAALAADQAFASALMEAYGAGKAGDARYLPDGVHREKGFQKVLDAKAEKVKADEAWLAEMGKNRGGSK